MMEENKTIYLDQQMHTQSILIYCNGQIKTQRLSGSQILGRPASGLAPDISVASGILSRKHGLFETVAGRCIYQDLESTNGTSCNGVKLKPHQQRMLTDGDVLRVQGNEGDRSDVLLVYRTSLKEEAGWSIQQLDDTIAEIVVGREQGLVLHAPEVSRKHASFFKAAKGWTLIDHGSLNGVRVNNRRIQEPVYLQPMDVVDIAGYLFIFTGTELVYQVDEESDRENLPEKNPEYEERSKTLDRDTLCKAAEALLYGEADSLADGKKEFFSAGKKVHLPHGNKENGSGLSRKPAGKLSVRIEERNVWQRFQKKTLLKNIHLEIPTGSMVLILGGSGAGKTTFMNAVMGFEPAEGRIMYQNVDIYREYQKMKYEIGYVPQQDLLRMNDTVYATLRNAASMRMSAGLPEQSYVDAVEATIQTLGLDKVRDSLVGKLSGGQRKRLSIAVEYIGDPSLFFLDEPDSGLDGTMARALMENLRTIADDGKIVIVISHSPDRAFELFDKVIVLAKDPRDDTGRLAFFGTPAEALSFFETDTLEHVVKRVNRKDEGGDGQAEHYIRRYEFLGGN